MNIILSLTSLSSMVTPPTQLNESLFFTDKKKNIIIDGLFTKILYSTPCFTMNGLYIQFELCSKILSDTATFTMGGYPTSNTSRNTHSSRYRVSKNLERATSVRLRELSGDGLPLKDNTIITDRRQFDVCRGDSSIACISGRRTDTSSGLFGDGCSSKDNVPFLDNGMESCFHKTYIQFDTFDEQNRLKIENLCKIERHILNVYSNKQFIYGTKTPVYGLKTQLHSGCVRAHTEYIVNFSNEEEYNTHPQFTKYIKISGVWETDQAYGITYKVFTE